MNERLTTHGLTEFLANQKGMDRKKADDFVKTLVSFFAHGMEKNKIVKIAGIGTFKIMLVRERESVHIQTGERFVIPAHHKLTFVSDQELKKKINTPLAMFESIEASDSEILALQSQDADSFKGRKFKPTGPIVVPFAGSTLRTEDENPFPAPSTLDNDDDYEISTYEEVEPLQAELTYEEEVEPLQAKLTYEEEAEPLQAELTYEEEAEPLQAELTYEEEAEPQPQPQPEDMDYIADSASIKENMAYKANVGKSFFSSKRNKVIAFTLSFLLVLVVLFFGARSATYKFLQSNTDKTTHQPQDFSDIASATTDDDIYAFETVQDSLGSETNLTKDEGIAEPKPISPNTNASNTTNKQEEETFNDWMAPSPSNNVKMETNRRANQPNKEIEERNRGLANNARQGAARNTSGTTAESKNTSTATPATTTTSTARSAQFPARIKMRAGSTLRQLALENYGDKAFWVYIYEANKSRISNPDQIPIGTELVLPAPSTYGIDSKSPASIEKALQKGRQLSR